MEFLIAFIVLLCVLTINLFASGPLQQAMGLWGTAVAELGYAAAAVAGAVAMIAVARKKKIDGVDGDEIFSTRLPTARCAMGGVLLVMASFLTSSLYATVVYALFPEKTQSTVSGLQSVFSGSDLSALLIVGALFPAICEELVFRGVTQYAVGRYGSPRVTILMTGLIFGVFHADPVRIPIAAATGIALSYALWRSRSIFVPMLMHLSNNAASLIISRIGLAMESSAEAAVSGQAAYIAGIAELTVLALGLLAGGLALLEEKPVEAWRRHRVTVIVLAGIVVLLGGGCVALELMA